MLISTVLVETTMMMMKVSSADEEAVPAERFTRERFDQAERSTTAEHAFSFNGSLYKDTVESFDLFYWMLSKYSS